MAKTDELGALPAGVRGIDEYGRNVAAATGQAALGMGQFGLGLNQQYKDQYQPYDAKLMGFVDHLGSDGYRNAQRAQAMNTVQQQSDAQRQQMQRQAMATGVNMSDPRFAFMQGQQAQQTALGKTMAAMGSDRNARDEWVKGLGAVNAMGLKVGELGLKNLMAAGDMAKTGLVGMDLGAAAQARETQANASAASAAASGVSAGAAAANAANNYQLGLGKLALDSRQVDNQFTLGLGGLARDMHNIDSNAQYNQGRLALDKDKNSLGTVAGSVLIGGAADWLLKDGGAKAVTDLAKGWFAPSDYTTFTPDPTVMTDASGDFQFDY